MTTVRHQGTTVGFAMDADRRIVYSALDLSTPDAERGELDVAYWAETPVEVPFPAEITEVGYAVAGATAMPTVKRGGRVEAAADEELDPEDVDPFLSTTARLSAAAPFQVISDGTHVVVLRQAVDAGHPDAVFKLTGGGCSGDSTRDDVVLDDGDWVPLVRDTLLCDRFLLVDGVLKPVLEVRYRRSRNKSLPASSKDSLGSEDMDGVPFREPTQELSFVRNLSGGRFTATLVPTVIAGVWRWQIFAYNQATGRMDSFSVEQAEDGLFNTRGSRFYTSPDPQYADAVFERSPGTCPFTEQPLVPIVSTSGHAESALRFDGVGAHLDLGVLAALDPTTGYTIEAWVRPDAHGGHIVTQRGDAGGYALGIGGDGSVVLDHTGASSTVVSADHLVLDQFTHVAATFDGRTASVYVDGRLADNAELPFVAVPDAPAFIGAVSSEGQPAGFFHGVIDEVRIWNRARTAEEFADDRHHRLVGNEPGLVAYYRLDEGTGGIAHDQTDNALHATLRDGPSWIISDAPLGEHPGVRRDSFSLGGRTITSAPACLVYHQQETAPAGYGGSTKPAKQQARVLLAAATGGQDPVDGSPSTQSYAAVLDFAVGRDGGLARVPDDITLPVLTRPTLSQDFDAVSALEQHIGALQADVTALPREIDVLAAQITTLPELRAARDQAAATVATRQAAVDAESPDDTKWYVRFRFKNQRNGANQYMTAYRNFTGNEVRLVRTGDPDAPSALWWLQSASRMHRNYPLYYVRNFNSNRDVNVYGAWQGDGTTVQQYTHTPGATNSMFYLAAPQEHDPYHFLVAEHSGKGVTALDSASLDGTCLQQYSTTTQTQAALMQMERVQLISGADARLQEAQNALAVAQAALDPLLALQALMFERQQTLVAKQVELAEARERLAAMTGGARGEADIAVGMPLITLDYTGLGCAAGLLTFARGADAPALLDSATGSVVLYFRGANEQFFVVYYDTRVARSTQVLNTPDGPVVFTARDAAIDLSEFSVSVTDIGDPRRCDLTISGGGYGTETWRAVPRAVRDLAAVLGGDGGTPVAVGTAAKATGTGLELETGSLATLRDGDHVLVGERGFVVSGDHPIGTVVISLRQAPGSVDVIDVGEGVAVGLVRYDFGHASASEPAGVSLATGSRLLSITAAPGGQLPDGTATVATSGRGCRWRGDMPGRAYAFDGVSQYLTLPMPHLDQAGVTGDVSIEAWVNPDQVQGTARVVHADTDTSTYTVVLTEASLDTALVLDGVDDAVDLADEVDLADRDLTVELWLRHSGTADRDETVLTLGPAGSALTLGFTAAKEFVFSLDGELLTTTESYTDQQWHHWAVTYERAGRSQVVYRDGAEVARRTAGDGAGAGVGPLRLGNAPGSNVYWAGAVDEVRVFGRVRDAEEILAGRDQRLGGREPGLLGHWTFPGADAVASGIKGYRIVAGSGTTFVRTRESFPVREWANLAVCYEQSWAVILRDGAYLDAGADDQLDLTGDLTVEAFLRLDRLGVTHGLLGKGRVADGSGGSVPYQLSVRPDGTLEFLFEDDETGSVVRQVRHTSTRALRAGTFHRVAVTRENCQSTPTAEHPEVDSWVQITFHLDGAQAGTYQYRGVGPVGNSGPLEIGRVRAGSVVSPMRGVLGEVRIWSVARTGVQLRGELSPKDGGLVARWRFEENTGNVTVDTTGSFPARLRRARWTTDPDPLASRFRLYRNGQSLACDPLAESEAPASDGYGDKQVTLGARLDSGAPTEILGGTLEEVRIWRVVRTEEEILDNLFSRLKGEWEKLVAYWPFDADSTQPGAVRVRDEGLRGNHLGFGPVATRPVPVLSTAPISADAAMVRSALAAVHTPFHELISAAPAATEYADLQHTAKGEVTGVLKRCYTYLRDGHWHLHTGYKVGNLTTEWVSQVQFDPQLVGFVEGAPPVPSENLTYHGDDDYTGASSVAFTEADDVVYSLSSVKDSSVDTAVSMALSSGAAATVFAVAAPLGFGFATKAAEVDTAVTGGASFEFSNAWSHDTSLSQGQNTTESLTVSLTGHWEDPSRILNLGVGRRFIPANTGFALVQSETADVFALRLEHTGALVAYRMRPNPDIPKDWNIITFPINPRYTKQGTLDGAVGFDNHGKVVDPDYPTAQGYGEYSYFKPREAYALKRRIQRAQQKLSSYYDSVSTETHRADPTGERAMKMLSTMTGVQAPDGRAAGGGSGASGSAHRDLVNTYVWTAAGGFFAETTEFTDVVSQTTAGSYSVTGSVEVGVSFQMSIGAKLTNEVNASIGGGMTVTRAKSWEAARSFGLEVTCEPSGDLQYYDDRGEPVYGRSGEPAKIHGKVDAYRFLTYYLGESGANFDDFYHKVVDPIWLNGSGDPHATALRQAQQSGAKPPCWRIMHRVTFVSRLLPPIPPPGAPPVETAMKAMNIDSNYELITRLEPYVRAATSPSELADATRAALAAHLPELVPHADTVIRYLMLYYGLGGELARF